MSQTSSWILYGSYLSPFLLKIKALLDYQQRDYRVLFAEGNCFENIKIQLRKMALTRGWLKLSYPQMQAGDEFPLVPYLFGSNGENIYDSTAVAHYLQQHPAGGNRASLFSADPIINFALALIDDYADEFMLYMVHHNRWKVAANNQSAAILARELRSVLGVLSPVVEYYFSRRQVRRLPYLFSVAEAGFKIDNLAPSLTPPSHRDFPPTHQFLETSYAQLLQALENIFKTNSYIFGNCFSLADAAIYGQLAMNSYDKVGAKKPIDAIIEQTAPHTYKWLHKIKNAQFSRPQPKNKSYQLSELHRPLFAAINATYLPLMEQNLAAYRKFKQQGSSLFNERAWRHNSAIYSGKIGNYPFKQVAKSFQANSFLKLKQHYQTLDTKQRLELKKFIDTSYFAPKN